MALKTVETVEKTTNSCLIMVILHKKIVIRDLPLTLIDVLLFIRIFWSNVFCHFESKINLEEIYLVPTYNWWPGDFCYMTLWPVIGNYSGNQYLLERAWAFVFTLTFNFFITPFRVHSTLSTLSVKQYQFFLIF